MIKYFLIIITLIIPFFVCSQQINYPLNHQLNISVNKQINYTDNYIHTGFKPLLKSYLTQFSDFDSIIYLKHRDSLFLSKRNHKWFWKKLRTEDFIVIKQKDIYVTISPLLNYEFGKELTENKFLNINTRGLIIKGNIGNKISFFSDLLESQAFYPEYISSYINKKTVVPGQGRKKTFKDTGFDYSSTSGYISITPYKKINFQLGTGKNFIGEGYRSLLLSDASFNYPFFKITTTFKRIQYINMLTAFQNVSNSDSRLTSYKRKHGSFNYLNILISKNLQIGFFEGIIWQTSDSTYNDRFSADYFNPVIYERLSRYSLNNKNNILAGLNVKLKICNPLQLYGQFVIDDIDLKKISGGKGYFDNKYGFQAGLKYFDLFTIKNLYFQAEYNRVQPYTYSHNIPMQNYSNFNEPLAHPLGANFKELIVFLDYKYKDFFIDLKCNYQITGKDTNNLSCGSDIFISDKYSYNGNHSYGNITGQGLNTEIIYSSVILGYLLNPATNLQLYIGMNYRLYKTKINQSESNFIFCGIRTSLDNFYFDF